MNASDYILRPMVVEDVPAYVRMLKRSFNTWWRQHGRERDRYGCDERELAIYWQIYQRISPGHCVAAFEPRSSALAGACFYHPRERHVSLGVMAVDPDFFGRGVGRRLVQHVIDFTQRAGYDALRLVGSAMNLDSFSLYNRAGFIPRAVYQDMLVRVPETGMEHSSPIAGRVRAASIEDLAGIKSLELAVSGICREVDYRFCIENPVGCLHASVIENPDGTIVGFAASIMHPVLRMVGPAFSRTEEEMIALLLAELDRFRGGSVLLMIPVEKRNLVEALYRWKAMNVETHLLQVRGEFQPFAGVNLPSFLPETG